MNKFRPLGMNRLSNCRKISCESLAHISEGFRSKEDGA